MMLITTGAYLHHQGDMLLWQQIMHSYVSQDVSGASKLSNNYLAKY